MGILEVLKDEPGLIAIVAERQRQKTEEGYSVEHDKQHDPEDLVKAAVAYLEESAFKWPWGIELFKLSPGDRVKELTKAGALIAAALDVYYVYNRSSEPSFIDGSNI